jgi:cytidylate kinase
MIIALDGPAGAGKSTIATQVATTLGFQLIDTGAIYRAVAHQALANDLELTDGAACAELARGLEFAFEFQDGVNRIYCNGALLGAEIREASVSLAASTVSAHPEVREALLDLQRVLGRERDSVLEGRDIGTVVFPNAEVKVFLTATPEERAKRRVSQRAEQGVTEGYDQVLSDIKERDHRDMTRAVAPLKQAEDAVALDTTGLNVDEIVARIVALVKR